MLRIAIPEPLDCVLVQDSGCNDPITACTPYSLPSFLRSTARYVYTCILRRGYREALPVQLPSFLEPISSFSPFIKMPIISVSFPLLLNQLNLSSYNLLITLKNCDWYDRETVLGLNMNDEQFALWPLINLKHVTNNTRYSVLHWSQVKKFPTIMMILSRMSGPSVYFISHPSKAQSRPTPLCSLFVIQHCSQSRLTAPSINTRYFTLPFILYSDRDWRFLPLDVIFSTIQPGSDFVTVISISFFLASIKTLSKPLNRSNTFHLVPSCLEYILTDRSTPQ